MIYEKLLKLNIKYEEISHQAIYTVKDAKKIKGKINGVGAKNLFLTNHKNKFYLYILKDNKKASLKELELFLNESHLSFASEKSLKEILKVEKGSVTPLAIINDMNNLTELIIDKELVGEKLLCHPITNEKTISISYEDLIRFVESENHLCRIF